MNALTRTKLFVVLTSLTFVPGLATSVVASQPQAVLLPPEHDHCLPLPKFGFSSFNIAGVGERVTHVRWGGLASQMGLEPGDLILSVNGFPLSYHGSWNEALHQAIAQGGFVRLKIRDVRTGFIAWRQTFVGGEVGPITPKAHFDEGIGPVAHYQMQHNHQYGVGYPYGPVTAKSKVAPKDQPNGGLKLHQIVKLFED